MASPRKYVLGEVNTAVRNEFPSIIVSGRTVNTPASFPALSVVLYNQPEYGQMADSTGEEVGTELYFEITAISNKKVNSTSYAMTECEEITAIVNATMKGLNFRRILSQPLDTVADDGIYRIVSRYQGVVDNVHERFYRR